VSNRLNGCHAKIRSSLSDSWTLFWKRLADLKSRQIGEVKRMIFHVTLVQAEDGWIVAECPALPGCVSQGEDEKEALENIKEAITAWLWAEDQKAVAALPRQNGSQPILVTV
jgi:predicted RNase H-like HicB family nuclease